MLKISDYLAITAGFAGIFLFYLIFSGSIQINYGTEGGLSVIEREEAVEKPQPETAQYVVLYGNEKESKLSCQIMQMLDKMKKDYLAKETMKELSERQKEEAGVFIVTTGSLDEADTEQELLSLVRDEGKCVFYAVLTGENAEYERELGILESRGKAEIDGMMVFEGILVQGMVYYENLPMEIREISLDASCTRLIQEQSKTFKEQRYLLPILWKKQYGSGEIYSCNGPFFESESDIGIFAGILYEMEETFLYPVVNSRAVLLDYYPDPEQADAQAIYELYSREPIAYIRDVIWPAIDKIRHENNLVISGRSYAQDRDDEFYDLQRQIQRNNGIVMEEGEGTILPVISEGHRQADEKRYWMESAASGWGIASSYLDMREVMGSKKDTEEFEWAAYSLELTKSMYDVYRNNQFLEAVNWLEAQERLKRYERIRPEFEITDDSIQIRADGFVDVWYCMVRTRRDLEDGQGYEIQKIGDDAYLLQISQQEVAISMQ